MAKEQPPISLEECIAFAAGLVNDPSGEKLKNFLGSDPRFALIINQVINLFNANPEIMQKMGNQSGIPTDEILASHKRLKTACVEVMGESNDDGSTSDTEDAEA